MIKQMPNLKWSRCIFIKYLQDFSSPSQKDNLLAYFPLYRLLLISTLVSLAIKKQEGKESRWEGTLGRGTPNERNGQKYNLVLAQVLQNGIDHVGIVNKAS